MKKGMSAKANVFIGEAPESDSEDELNISDGVPLPMKLPSAQGKIVSGEAPESDDETLGKSGSLDSISSAISAGSSTICADNKPRLKSNGSLLTKKLCERNISLGKNVHDFVSRTVSTSNNELNTVDQHLLKCQLSLQEASELLQTINMNVSKLDSKIQSLLSASYIPDIRIEKTESSRHSKMDQSVASQVI